MPPCLYKISNLIFRKRFLLICVCCFILLPFYLYYKEYDSLLNLVTSRMLLHPNTFKNSSRTPKIQQCLLAKQRDDGDFGLIFILSAPQNILRRQIIRSTWSQPSAMKKLHFGVVFIVGETNNIQILTQNIFEAEMFGDIVRAHLTDSHLYLAQKTIVGLQWVLADCPRAKVVIKADDDVFVNPFALRKLLQNISSQKSFYQLIKERETSATKTGEKITHSNFPKNSSISLQSLGNANNNIASASVVNMSEEFLRKLFPPRNSLTRDLKSVIKPHKISTKVDQNFSKSSTLFLATDFKVHSPNDTTKDIGYKEKILCFVGRNISFLKDSNFNVSIKEESSKDYIYQTYCSGGAYILPISVAKQLVNAHKKKNASEIIFPENEYVTGVLANNAGVGHIHIGSRYALKSNDVEAIAKDGIIFTHLGNDVETLTYKIWKSIEQEYNRTHSEKSR